MNFLWSNHLIAFYFLCSKCYLTYLEVAWNWIVAWCYRASYVQHFIWPLSLLTDWQLTVPVQRWSFSSSSVPQVPAATVCFFFFPQQLLSGMSDSRVNVERWKSTQILQTEEWAPSDVALCCGACLSTQQWPISPCPSGYHSRGHSPSTGCICAHWTIRGPSKCILIWCVQLPFAWTMAIILGLFWKWIEYEVL